MIYSSFHRQSLLESLVNLLPPIFIVVTAFAVALTGWLIPHDINWIEWAVGTAISLVIATVIHELAHLAVGLLAGRQVQKILIGSGKTIFTARLGGIRVQICENLIDGGAVLFSALDDPSRNGLVAAIAAGPASNLIAGLYAYTVVAQGGTWLSAFALVNVLIGITNYWPARFMVGEQSHVTDGMQILRLLSGRPLTAAFFEGEEMATDAKRATIGAIEQARDAGSAEVEEVHLLAALDRDPDIHRLLAPASIHDLVRWSGPTEGDDLRPIRTATVDAVEKAAFHIARDAGLTRPNAPCLLLALMAVPSPVATRLKEGGVSEAALRGLAVSRGEPAPEPGSSATVIPDLPLERWGTAADRPLEMAFRIATADRAETTGTQHIVAALSNDLDCRAGRALWQMGFAMRRDGRLVPPGSPPPTPPPMSPQAAAAIAGALLRTGPTYATGSGELCLGVCDQGRGMGGLLFVRADVSSDGLVSVLRNLPREQSDPIGYTPSTRRMWELRASARLGAGRHAESLADFRVLENTATTDESLAISRNNVAYIGLLTGDPGLRTEALEKARLALAFRPQQPSFRGTYGFALLENGSTADAADVLEKVIGDQTRPRDRALDLCLLAICRTRLGDREAARRHIVEAEAADPRCNLLERARAESGVSSAAATTVSG